MEKQVNGVITSIVFGHIFNGQFGETCPCTVTINNELFSCFVKPYNGTCKLQTKKGKTYVDIKEGMHVVFDATSNERDGKTYWNFKPLSVMIMADSGTQNTQTTNYTTQEEKVPHNASDGVTKDDLVNGVCVGFASSVVLYHLNGNIPSDIEERLQRLVGELKTKYFKL